MMVNPVHQDNKVSKVNVESADRLVLQVNVVKMMQLGSQTLEDNRKLLVHQKEMALMDSLVSPVLKNKVDLQDNKDSLANKEVLVNLDNLDNLDNEEL